MWGSKNNDSNDKSKKDLPQRRAGSTLSKEDQKKVQDRRKEIQEGYNRQWESNWW
jgi:hypothetical protein